MTNCDRIFHSYLITVQRFFLNYIAPFSEYFPIMVIGDINKDGKAQ